MNPKWWIRLNHLYSYINYYVIFLFLLESSREKLLTRWVIHFIPNYPSEESYSKVFQWLIRENDSIVAAKWLSASDGFQIILMVSWPWHTVPYGPYPADGSTRTSPRSMIPNKFKSKNLKNHGRSIRYKFDKSKYPSFNNPDGYLSREKCAKLTKLFIVVGVTAVCDQEIVQLKINRSSFGSSEFVLRIHDLCTCKRILNISNLDSSVI